MFLLVFFCFAFQKKVIFHHHHLHCFIPKYPYPYSFISIFSISTSVTFIIITIFLPLISFTIIRLFFPKPQTPSSSLSPTQLPHSFCCFLRVYGLRAREKVTKNIKVGSDLLWGRFLCSLYLIVFLGLIWILGSLLFLNHHLEWDWLEASMVLNIDVCWSSKW